MGNCVQVVGGWGLGRASGRVCGSQILIESGMLNLGLPHLAFSLCISNQSTGPMAHCSKYPPVN